MGEDSKNYRVEKKVIRGVETVTIVHKEKEENAAIPKYRNSKK